PNREILAQPAENQEGIAQRATGRSDRARSCSSRVPTNTGRESASVLISGVLGLTTTTCYDRTLRLAKFKAFETAVGRVEAGESSESLGLLNSGVRTNARTRPAFLLGICLPQAELPVRPLVSSRLDVDSFACLLPVLDRRYLFALLGTGADLRVG